MKAVVQRVTLGRVVVDGVTLGEIGHGLVVLLGIGQGDGEEQVQWMAAKRNAAKGCILLTHHQPASSRASEAQHADEAVAMLEKAGVYPQIDAWLWGHEHRCVIFKPKGGRKNPALKKAPGFCACLGNGGVPVT